MMKYFELFELPVSFHVDEARLKTKFLQLSRDHHPDRFTLESEERQEEALEQSTEINEGYKVLKDFDKRLQYILQSKGALVGEGQDKLPQDFLMDMMDINEEIMDLQFDPDPEMTASAKQKITAFEKTLQDSIAEVLSKPDAVHDESAIDAARDYYLKKKYLTRIYENLDNVGRM